VGRYGSRAFAQLTRLPPWLILAACAILLVTFGGAVVAAPLTIPLLVRTGRTATSGTIRVLAALVAGLTAAQVAWALVYIAVGESQPSIWLMPAAACLLAVTVVLRSRERA
jgi:hypothetical protein